MTGRSPRERGELVVGKRDVVVDVRGNHFSVTKVDGNYVLLESVVTKECFRAPISDVTVVEGLAAR